MHRIDGAGHVNNQFVSEDPATNRPPTEVTAEILNALQEELASVVERTGRVLDKSNNTQVGDSIQNMIEARVGDYNLDTGTANAKVVALNPAIAAYTGNFGGAFKMFWLTLVPRARVRRGIVSAMPAMASLATRRYSLMCQLVCFGRCDSMALSSTA